jgi:hypothetical protein
LYKFVVRIKSINTQNTLKNIESSYNSSPSCFVCCGFYPSDQWVDKWSISSYLRNSFLNIKLLSLIFT